MPAAEVTAVNNAYAKIDQRLTTLEGGPLPNEAGDSDASDDDTAALIAETRVRADEAYASSQVFASQSGKDALQGFWSCADVLAEIAASLGL